MKLLSKIFFESVSEKYVVLLNVDNCYPIDMYNLLNKFQLESDRFKYADARVILLTKHDFLLKYPFSYYDYNKKMEHNYLCITDSKRVVRHISYFQNFLSIDIEEVFRNLHAINEIEKKGVLCPANWYPGEPTISQSQWDEVEKQFSK